MLGSIDSLICIRIMVVICDSIDINISIVMLSSDLLDNSVNKPYIVC